MHRNYGTASPSSWKLLLMIQWSRGSHGPKHQFCFQIQAKGGRIVSNNESLSHCCNHLNTVLTDMSMVSGSFSVGILGSVAFLVHSHVQTLLPKAGPSGGCSADTSPPPCTLLCVAFPSDYLFSCRLSRWHFGIPFCQQTLVIIYSPPMVYSTSSRFSFLTTGLEACS